MATAAMLSEINFCATRLQLALPLPVRADAILRQFILPPERRSSFAGRIDTFQYSFSFPRSGRLGYITRLQEGTPVAALQPPEGVAIKDHLWQLAHRKSRLDTDDAYRLAAKWLAAIEVDVRSLEFQHPLHARQMKYRRGTWLMLFHRQVPLPVFEVKWGLVEPHTHRYPVVTITLYGDTQELLELRQEDDSYSKCPTEIISEMDKLLAISDEAFSNYSDIERNDLVTRFTKVSPPV
ncbi:MAG: hypothetical protein KJ070_15670 [Verrucomicrobia bacterium]|nr:hypothetical protein [Verrucomicrobiota bacterium]